MTDEYTVIYQIITRLLPTVFFLYILIPSLLIALMKNFINNPNRY